MLSPSDYNSAVPQFTNGNYASNPINPLYIEEPGATDYNRGVEPLQTLPAQWWNWLANQFTLRFNKLNIYVKNIFNELTQLLSLMNITPDGTEGSPTIAQLKGAFQTEYPKYLALIMYPVGSLYWTGKAPDNGGDPNTLFGGTWVQIKGKFIFAKGDSDTLNDTGGAKTVTLTTTDLPDHHHSFSGSAVTSGGSSAANTGNTQPSFTGTAVTSGGSSATNTGAMSGNSTGYFEGRDNWFRAGYGGNVNIYYVPTSQASAQDRVAVQSTQAARERCDINVSHTHNMAHTHSVTAAGTVQNHSHTMAHTHSVTAAGKATGIRNTSDATFTQTAVDKMPPYVVKYCWERTA